MKLYTLINKNLTNFGHRHVLGENVFTDKFDANEKTEDEDGFRSSSGDGLYFNEEEDIWDLLEHLPDPYWIGEVSLCPDSRVVEFTGGMKTDKFILEHVVSISEYLKKNPEECSHIVGTNGHALRFIEEQTPELCMIAVNTNGFALKYVKWQHSGLCLAAVSRDGYALQYVKEQTPEICMAAVKNYGGALKYVQNQTREICMEAVKQYGFALEFVKEQTPEICQAAVLKNGFALRFVESHIPAMLLSENKKIMEGTLDKINPSRKEVVGCLDGVRNLIS